MTIDQYEGDPVIRLADKRASWRGEEYGPPVPAESADELRQTIADLEALAPAARAADEKLYAENIRQRYARKPREGGRYFPIKWPQPRALSWPLLEARIIAAQADLIRAETSAVSPGGLPPGA